MPVDVKFINTINFVINEVNNKQMASHINLCLHITYRFPKYDTDSIWQPLY